VEVGLDHEGWRRQDVGQQLVLQSYIARKGAAEADFRNGECGYTERDKHKCNQGSGPVSGMGLNHRRPNLPMIITDIDLYWLVAAKLFCSPA
jgi:hypothetical protein